MSSAQLPHMACPVQQPAQLQASAYLRAAVRNCVDTLAEQAVCCLSQSANITASGSL
jgi:hypothetical protein